MSILYNDNMEKEKKLIITHIKKDNHGRVVEFKTNDNIVLNYEMALEAIDNQIIENIIINNKGIGRKIIESKNQETKIEDFPEF